MLELFQKVYSRLRLISNHNFNFYLRGFGPFTIMRIILSLILIFSAPCSALASDLGWLDPTKLGPTLKSLQGQNLSLDNTKSGPASYNYDGGKVIRDVALWGSLLRMGKLTPYGRLAVPAALLVEQAYNKGLFDDSFFAPYVGRAFNPPVHSGDTGLLPVGSYIYHNGAYYQITGDAYPSGGFVDPSTFLTRYTRLGGTSYYIWNHSLLFYIDYSRTHPDSPGFYEKMYVPYKRVLDIPHVTPTKPIPLDVLDRLIDEIGRALEKNDQAARDLAYKIDDLIKNNPDIIDHPDLLKSPDVKDSIANDKIDTIQNQLDNINSQLENDPNNTELQQKKLDLEKQLEDISDKTNEEKLDENVDVPTFAVPDLKQINLDPIKETQGILMNKFPFSVLSAAGSLFSALVAPPLAPSFVIDLGITSVTIDLSRFDSFAANIRAVMSFLIYGLCGYVSLRIWSRF